MPPPIQAQELQSSLLARPGIQRLSSCSRSRHTHPCCCCAPQVAVLDQADTGEDARSFFSLLGEADPAAASSSVQHSAAAPTPLHAPASAASAAAAPPRLFQLSGTQVAEIPGVPSRQVGRTRGEGGLRKPHPKLPSAASGVRDPPPQAHPPHACPLPQRGRRSHLCSTGQYGLVANDKVWVWQGARAATGTAPPLAAGAALTKHVGLPPDTHVTVCKERLEPGLFMCFFKGAPSRFATVGRSTGSPFI